MGCRWRARTRRFVGALRIRLTLLGRLLLRSLRTLWCWVRLPTPWTRTRRRGAGAPGGALPPGGGVAVSGPRRWAAVRSGDAAGDWVLPLGKPHWSHPRARKGGRAGAGRGGGLAGG